MRRRLSAFLKLLLSLYSLPLFILLIKEEIMKTIISDKSILCKNAAKYIAELLKEKKDANIAFSAADLDDEFFDCMADFCKAGEADFANAKIFGVGEFVSEKILASNLTGRLLDKINVRRENCFLPDDSNYDTYDDLIASFGGLDLIVLGIGSNCRLAFNEPGTPFSSLTHIQKLTEVSVKQLGAFFSGEAKIPEKVITLGIKSITNAKRILLMVFGEELSDALFSTVYARNDASVPSAFLQIPLEVTIFADRAAAIKL